jgi:hypothetical protein
MRTAVEHYMRHRGETEAWMLGRFVTPVARLDEFEICAPRSGLRLSALIGGDLEADLPRIADFNLRENQIDAIEMKVSAARQIESAAARIPPGITAYFEVADVALVSAIQAPHRAKIRAGGVTTDAFPESAQIARFLEACATHRVAFKATAGLHHPLRCYCPLTYSPDGPSGWMFGFLNVFIAAVLAWRGARGEELERALVAESAAGLPSIDETEAAATRRDFAISFGSCSFQEPVADLKALHLL